MASSKKKRRSRKAFVPLDPGNPFPFMSLPPEIRLMVYDFLIREQTAMSYKWGVPAGTVGLSDSHNMLSSSVKSLLKVKDIRAEIFPQLLSRYQFEWAEAGDWTSSERWESFKRYVLPFISSLTITIHDKDRPRKSSIKLFTIILKWMRWRSQRTHIHPWQLKSLTLKEGPRVTVPIPLWAFFRWERDGTERDVSHFLVNGPMVPGLESLTIVLKTKPQEEAAKACLERFAGCGVEGKLGYWHDDQRKVAYWFHLDEGQLIQTTI
ncbi:hypothetical protein KVR01_013549 [Diaporthe batatas]|uniref:uncharacterized protein n=1 Tax=Diaporthe batatas TaxID=748121 RepID=UPI001D04BD1F|nr:uncharacterized protein KVR01_013549 [Diaporthe batatas]KAG8156598.1 hypothetical protein KVR01_013549 [Diaporthe batatas]